MNNDVQLWLQKFPACLILFHSFHRKKGFGGTAGMAFVGTACSRSHGGGINAV